MALAVPCFAIGDAVRTLLQPDSGESLTALLDLRRWLVLLTNTAVVCGVALLTAVTVGGGLALLVTRTDWPGRRLLVGAALFGACVPVYVSTVVFFALVPAYFLAPSAVACGALYGLVYTPLAGLVMGTAFRSADRELEEQALLDAGPVRVLQRVTMPQASWGLAVTALIVVLLVATDFTITDILTVRTFAEEAYTQYALDQRHAGPLVTALPVLAGLAAALVLVQVRYRLLGEHSPWQWGAAPHVFALDRCRPLAIAASVVVLAAGLGAPLLLLVLHITSLSGLGRIVCELLKELLTSAVLAIGGATAVVLPAGGLAWHLVRGGWSRWLAAAALVLLLAMPAPVVGISLIALLNNELLGWLFDSPLKIVVGYFLRFLPIGVLLLLPAVQRVPREVEAAARVDGCDWLGVHWYVRVPTLLPDAAIVWLVILILCFAEVGTTVLLVLPNWPMASVRAFTLIHFGVYRDLAVLALLAVGSMLLPWGVLLWLLRRRRSALTRVTTAGG